MYIGYQVVAVSSMMWTDMCNIKIEPQQFRPGKVEQNGQKLNLQVSNVIHM